MTTPIFPPRSSSGCPISNSLLAKRSQRNCRFRPHLEFTVLQDFSLGRNFIARYATYVFKDFLSNLLDRRRSVEHIASREVQVTSHAIEDGIVRCQFDDRSDRI